MSANHDPLTDEQLERHVAAMRDERIEDGPSPQRVAATMEMLRRGGAEWSTPATGRRPFIERLAAMSMTQKIAAAVLITLGGMVLYVVFGVFDALSGGVAFGDVVEKVKSIRTAAYTTTVTLPGKPPVTMRTKALGPGRSRTETPDGSVSITNGRGALALDPKSHTATRIDFDRDPTPPGEQNVIESFRAMANAAGERVGERVIDGVACVGFRVLGGRGAGAATAPSASDRPTMTIWADKKTALPVRVESTLPAAEGFTMVVMDHFELDPPLDESQFSLDVPKGYTLAATQKIDLPAFTRPEEFVIDLLRAYAEANGGTFPPTLTDPAIVSKLVPRGADQAALAKAVVRAAAVSGAVIAMGDRCGYAGKDVKLGEKDTIVFWYPLDPKSGTYRAVFGDLHVADVTADKVPATQPIKP